jgi:hypothetical protein
MRIWFVALQWSVLMSFDYLPVERKICGYRDSVSFLEERQELFNHKIHYEGNGKRVWNFRPAFL